MINFDNVTKKVDIKHWLNWQPISNCPYRILIIGGSWSGKANLLFNLISYQPDVDKIHLYAKDSYEAKHQMLINKLEYPGLKHFNDS